MAIDRTEPDGMAPNSNPRTLSAARMTVAAKRARIESGWAVQTMLADPIAIVGMGCRFPGGADSPVAYWQLLDEGRSGIREMPASRWPGARETLKPHLLLGGYLDEVDGFDPEFFGIAPREAHSIDPQQRLLLEVCWEALLDAGMPPSSLGGSDTGVFIAVYNTDYLRMQMREGASFDAYTGVGAAHSVAAGRISFLLNLHGPCLAVDTACSSSLVATQLACQSLRQRECSVALVGGSSLKVLSDEVRIFAEWGMLSSNGQAKTFDAAADGFVPGEGCGVVVLKRLSDAIAQNDPIRAVIRGVAVNHDGRSNVLTAPNGLAQEAVLRAALRDAQIEPGDVSFIETHGTGTSLGDPIEVEALDAVYGSSSPAAGGSSAGCVLGAVKTNFGHLEASAGMAGLMKVVLALENAAIPRNLNFNQLNPHIRLQPGSRLQLATEARPWPRGVSPRFAAVSSFGLGGTNAHVLLEEAPILPARVETMSPNGTPLAYCLPISAHSMEGLGKVAGGYLRLLRQNGSDLGKIARAAARTRDHADFRIAVVGTSVAEVADKLEENIARISALAAQGVETQEREPQGFAGRGKVAFIFSGQGAVWQGMLPALLAQFPEAELVFATCERIVQETSGWSLRAAAGDPIMLADTAKAQPLLFAVQMALVRTLESWGIAPEAVAGHSVGEVAAVVTAGALTLEQGLQLVLKRGERMGAKPGAGDEEGRMLAADMSVAEAELALGEFARQCGGPTPEIAAINAPRSIVFSGPDSQMRKLADHLAKLNRNTRWLDVRYAFHSAAMEQASQALAQDLRVELVSPARPRSSISLISTQTGKAWAATDGSAAYWSAGIRRPVLLRQAVDELVQRGCRTVLEIGPHPVLLHSVKASVAEADQTGGVSAPMTTLAAMRRGQSARTTLMTAAAVLYEGGADLEWTRIYPGPLAPVALPPYPWNRQRYWLAEGKTSHLPSSASRQADPLPGRQISSPFVEGKLWQTSLSTVSEPWLAQHRRNDQPIYPFAAWLELARRAATVAAEGRAVTIREFAVHQPLFLSQTEVDLQTLATPARELKLAAMVDGSWQNFASGFWECNEALASEPAAEVDLAAFLRQSTESIAVETIYRELAAKGLSYGPAFRLLEHVHRGPGFALAEIRLLPDQEVLRPPELHPTFLDACLQTLQAAQPIEHRGLAVLPFSIGSYRVLRSANEVLSLVQLRSTSQGESEADIFITDKQGLLIAEIQALRVRTIPASEQPSAMWQTVWHELPQQEMTGGDAGSLWFVPAAEPSTPAGTRLHDEVVRAFEARGATICRANFGELSQRATSSRNRAFNVLLMGERAAVTAQLLEVVALEQHSPGLIGRVCLLTQAALAVHSGEVVDHEQAALVGLARTFRGEYPAIVVRLLDLPGASAAAAERVFAPVEGLDLSPDMAALESRKVAHWFGGSCDQCVDAGKSDEAALRHGKIYRPLLEPFRQKQAEALYQERTLVIQSSGRLETLKLENSHTPDPAPQEVQISCHAHGLNFRDVLTAVGSYAGVSAPLGAECAGVVLKVGADTGITPGTRVMAFAPGSMRSIVNVPAAYVVPKPAKMSFAEAATIPVAFLTAHYGFSRLANLQPGEVVLIHSAAGGLGQAAVQLARLSGATVIATAGTAEKRAYLHAQGIAHVFDSRGHHFEDEVRRATGGRGADVVLNALSGEKIAASFRVLRQGGAFLEVGKRSIWTVERVAEFRPDARYWAFDLGEVAATSPAIITEMLQEVLSAFEAGKLSPLPREVYSINDAEGAFREMASGRHIGKLVLAQPPQPITETTWAAAIREGTVLITGGTGALGIATARWLLEQGARSLILLSRSGTSDRAQRLQAESHARGVRVVLEGVDVTDREQFAGALRRARSIPDAPLRVVIHAAGEIDDRLLADHREAGFVQGMRSKLEGARLIDELTSEDGLAMTIYYSSVAALLGSAGQGSYAAANAWLDGLAEHRTALGLPTLSVNWGAWAEGGMVEQLSATAASRIARQGMQVMHPASALSALRRAIVAGQSHISICNVDWNAFREQFPSGSPTRRFFADYLPGVGSAVDTAIGTDGPAQTSRPDGIAEEFAAIAKAGRADRLSRMEACVRASARKILGLSAGRPIPGETPLQEMGLDSLTSLEMRNVLAQALGRPLSATLLFDYPTIRGLSQHLLRFLNPEMKDLESSPGAGWEIRESSHTIGIPFEEEELDFSKMSESEAEELLLAELDRRGRL